MAKFLLVTVALVVLLGSSCSEARPSYQGYGSSRRGTGGNPDSRRLSELEDLVSMLKRDVKELKEAADCPLAAFTAFFGIGDIAVVPAGDDPVVFPNAANYGDVYDTATGIFTAPVDGIYNFAVGFSPSDIDDNSNFASISIIKRRTNGVSFSIGRVTSNDDKLPFDFSSSNAVIYLDAGDEIFIRNDVTATFTAGEIFSGFLIKEVTLEDDK